MLHRSIIKKTLAGLRLALNRTLVATQRERDQAFQERDQAFQERDQAVAERKAVEGGKFDKFPAALFAAEAERDALRNQRDQAYGEIDDLCRERNELKGQLERLKNARSHRLTGTTSTKLLHHDPLALDFVQIELDRRDCLG